MGLLNICEGRVLKGLCNDLQTCWVAFLILLRMPEIGEIAETRTGILGPEEIRV